MADADDDVPPPVPPKRRQTKASRSFSDPNFVSSSSSNGRSGSDNSSAMPPRTAPPPASTRSRSDFGPTLAEKIRLSGVNDAAETTAATSAASEGHLPPPVPSKKKSSGRRPSGPAASLAAGAAAAAAALAAGNANRNGSGSGNRKPPPPARRPSSSSSSSSSTGPSSGAASPNVPRPPPARSDSSSSMSSAATDATSPTAPAPPSRKNRSASAAVAAVTSSIGSDTTTSSARATTTGTFRPPPPARKGSTASSGAGDGGGEEEEQQQQQGSSSRIASLGSVARRVLARETSMAKFCSTVRSSILSVKTRSIRLETSFASWLAAFEKMEREYVEGISSVVKLAENLESTKYKARVGRKIRRSRFVEQSAPIIRKIIAFHEEQIASFERVDKRDTIGSTVAVLDKYAGTLKKLLWVQIPYANAYAPAVTALQRLAERPEVLKSNTLQTNLAMALSALGGPVSYAGRLYAFFSKFLQATQTEGLSFTGNVARITAISDALLPSILHTLEDMASKCMTTALEGHLHQLLKQFPGLGAHVEDQELLNYGCCMVRDMVSEPEEGSGGSGEFDHFMNRRPSKGSGGRGGSGARQNKKKKLVDTQHDGQVELYLFSRMILKVWVSSVHNVSLLHGILLERDDLCLNSDGMYEVVPQQNGTVSRPRSTRNKDSHRSHVLNLTNEFQINFGAEYMQLRVDDISGRSISVIPREDRQHCCWNITPVQSLGTIKPLNRIKKRLEDKEFSSRPQSSGSSDGVGGSGKGGGSDDGRRRTDTSDLVHGSSTYSNVEEVAEWYEGLRLCVDYQKTREEEEAKLMASCQQGDVESVRSLIENGVSPNGRALLRGEGTEAGAPAFCSALEVALNHDHQEIARLLIRGGANVLRQESSGERSLAAKLYFENARLLCDVEERCTPSEADSLQAHLLEQFNRATGAKIRPTPSQQRRRSSAAEPMDGGGGGGGSSSGGGGGAVLQRKGSFKKAPHHGARGRRKSSMSGQGNPHHADGGDDADGTEQGATFHFGQPLRFCQCEMVAGYEAPIPSLLVYLKDAWLAAGGKDEEGVFRVACDAKRSDAIERFIFRTCFVSPMSLREFAADAWRDSALPSRIVKRFFRAMPEGGLIPLADLVKAFPALATATTVNPDSLPAMLKTLGHRRYWLFLWLLDWLAIPAANESETRMNPNNLAIVFGPNLYEQQIGQSVDPSMAIKYSKIINEFTKTALEWRMAATGVTASAPPREP